MGDQRKKEDESANAGVENEKVLGNESPIMNTIVIQILVVCARAQNHLNSFSSASSKTKTDTLGRPSGLMQKLWGNPSELQNEYLIAQTNWRIDFG